MSVEPLETNSSTPTPHDTGDMLFVADGRSPIALNWIRFFIDRGDRVHLVSTYPAEPPAGIRSFEFIPLAFSGAVSQRNSEPGRTSLIRTLTTPKFRTRIRQWFGVLTIPAAAKKLAGIIQTVKPRLVHAMRIPYEGMITAKALEGNPDIPTLISVWGNDFTLHAAATSQMGKLTRRALKRADAIHTDCRRDRELAVKWGFSNQKSAIVLPGGGGVQSELFFPPDARSEAHPTVINPRGFRAYVHNDAFFQAVPLILKQNPQVRFLCPTMATEPEAIRWVNDLQIQDSVDLMPAVTREEMGGLFRRSTIALSPSSHDGTPNTLLEAMACGSFPIAGDIESLREWIVDGKNGLLIHPDKPESIAEGVNRALGDAKLRQEANLLNLELIAKRALYPAVMREAAGFYNQLTGYTD